MNILLTNNHVTFSLEEGESNEPFLKIKEAVSYNQELYNMQKKYPELKDFSWDNVKQVKRLATVTRVPSFQHYAAYKYNKLVGNADVYFNPFFKVWINRKPQFGRRFNAYQMWNGRKSHFNVRKNSKNLKLRSGWFRRVYKFIIENYPEVEFNLYDERTNTVQFNMERVYDVGKFTFRDYQSEVLDTIIDSLEDVDSYGQLFTNVCVSLATNTGKTPLIGGIVKNLKDPKVLIPFHKKELVAQGVYDYMVSMDIQDLCVICSDKSKKYIIDYLKSKGIDKQPHWNEFGDIVLIMIPTYMSRFKRGTYSDDHLKEYTCGIFDECETFTAKTYTDFIDLTELGLKIGLSGTPLSSDDIARNFKVVDLFGSPRYTISNNENMDRGISQRPHVRFYKVDGKRWDSDIEGCTKAQKYIYRNDYRIDKLIQALRKRPDDQTVIYFGHAQIVDGEYLYDQLKQRMPEASIAITHGQDLNTIEKIQQFLEGNIQFLIVNFIIKRGINIKNIQHIVNWEATANRVNLEQGIIGRAIRLDGLSDIVYISDFRDNYGIYTAYSNIRYETYDMEQHGCVMLT